MSIFNGPLTCRYWGLQTTDDKIYVIVFRSVYAKQLFSGDIRCRLNRTTREQLVCLTCMHNSWNTYAKKWLFLALSLD